MVKQAADVLRRIESLPEAEQAILFDYLKRHLDDLLDEARWQESFERSPETLDKLSREVDAAIASSAVAPLYPDELWTPSARACSNRSSATCRRRFRTPHEKRSVCGELIRAIL